jgi:hypothetical protein
MEEIKEFAVNYHISQLEVNHRRSLLGLVKISVGNCAYSYRKVPVGKVDFGLLSLFSLEGCQGLENIMKGELQIEFYSEKSGLELICAGKVPIAPFQRITSDISHRKQDHGKILVLESSTEELVIPLYHKTGETFSIVAGQVNVIARLLRVQRSNLNLATPLSCQTCCLTNIQR